LLDAGNHPDHKSLEDAAQLLDEAPSGMPVAVGIFAQRAAFTRDFISDNNLLISSANRLIQQSQALGTGSNSHYALTQALGRFGPHQPGDTILLVTSGNEHESKRAFNDLRREFRRRGTRLQLLAGLIPAAQADDSSG